MNTEKISITEKVYGADEVPEIADIARSRGIEVPSTHLAFFKTVYAPLEEANQNGVRLATKAVKDSLSGLNGAQVNLEHLGYGFITGSILDAWINSNGEIEVAFTFFKEIYSEEYTKALGLLAQGKLTVSFELLTDPSTKEVLADGTIRLHDIDFTGMGLLMDNPPAYKEAIVYEYANTLKERAKRCENKELVYASKLIETCDKIIEENNQEGGTKGMKKIKEQVEAEKIEEEVVVEESSENTSEEKTEEKVTEVKIEDESAEAEKEEKEADGSEEAKEVSEETEEATEEAKESEEETEVVSEKTEDEEASSEEDKEEETEEASEKTEEVSEEKEEAQTTYVTEENKVIVENSDENESSVVVFKDMVVTCSVDGEVVWTETVTRLSEETLTFAQLESKVAELQEALTAKDSEIENVRENAEKIGKLKVELKDNPYVAEFEQEDFLNETKVEHIKTKFENDQLKAKLGKIKETESEEEETEAEEVEAKVDEDLDTGFKGKSKSQGLREVIKAEYKRKK